MIKTLFLILIPYLLSGCLALHKSPSSVSVYDFGTPQHQNMQPSKHSKSILIADATAPSWLDNHAIHYRLLYHNPSQLYTYANSRWIAPPAAIFTQQIRDRVATRTDTQVIKNSSTAKADYILHIELEEFIQLFDSLKNSYVAIGLRASLIERNSRHLLVQKDFRIKEQASTADAAGAVAALGIASNQLISELIEWITLKLPPN
ncbi:ABC-type transport auxiliary lipoprotein family protein [Nitrosomonas sp. Nm166]|uniref:ABC-type transport auxiliary lipoprotein family protein n=1 Tax=Nitrosomonas sp. Nm166 TaxID=1881054 RepID=UPI0008E15896|nr:ABC-type transport auxiliary lipoprotein family protein [Nitrosomonas sp. Nm166]SFE55629.1 cholesterol transport system auxiliary component [Nitrosomonas sp. Nm166]